MPVFPSFLAMAATLASTVVVTAPMAKQPLVSEAPCGARPVVHRIHHTAHRTVMHHTPVRPLPYQLVNHHLVKRRPAPEIGCMVGGSAPVFMSSLPAGVDELPALSIATPDVLDIPGLAQPAVLELDDSGGGGGSGPLPIGYGDIPTGGVTLIPTTTEPGAGPSAPVSPSPEPQTWALMISGLAMLGVWLRVRNARQLNLQRSTD